jgi:hypothetical protein
LLGCHNGTDLCGGALEKFAGCLDVHRLREEPTWSDTSMVAVWFTARRIVERARWQNWEQRLPESMAGGMLRNK